MKDSAIVLAITGLALAIVLAGVSLCTPSQGSGPDQHEPGPYGGAGVWLGEYDDDGRPKR